MLWSMALDVDTKVPASTGALRSLTSQIKEVVLMPWLSSSVSSLLMK